MNIADRLNSKLETLKQQNNLRRITLSKELIDFASNDYLGFARDHELHQAVIDLWSNCKKPFLGSTGSRLLTGNHPLMLHLEQEIACFHCAEDGLLFNSGYSANMGIASAIATAEDVCIYDSHVHASTREGLRLGSARSIPWRHNDLRHLEKRLKFTETSGYKFIFVESIYSCDGSIAPLKDLCSLCQHYNAHLIVDEAHATGIIGRNGKGLVVEQDCQHAVFARIHTFSKALGGYGAILLCSRLLKDYLINFSCPLIYSTSLPVSVLLTIQASYQNLKQAEAKILSLQNLVDVFKRKAGGSKLPFLPSNTPIQSLIAPGSANARRISAALAQKGFDVRALTSPTVKKGTERLRICLHAYNQASEVDSLLSSISSIYFSRNEGAI